jgi:hypothetical protein
MAHIINLAVQTFLNTLKIEDQSHLEEEEFEPKGVISRLQIVIAKIRASPQRRERFNVQCKALGIVPKEQILDVKTRWNSTYSMIKRALELAEVRALS